MQHQSCPFPQITLHLLKAIGAGLCVAVRVRGCATGPLPRRPLLYRCPSPQPSPTVRPTVLPTNPPPTRTSTPPPFVPVPPPEREFATLEDFWSGIAEWVMQVYDVGLPVGESDTCLSGGTEFWSYLHASRQSRRRGLVQQSGPFPGCVTLWKSTDGGLHFALDKPVCLFPCMACPCGPADHTQQQQYPRAFFRFRPRLHCL